MARKHTKNKTKSQTPVFTMDGADLISAETGATRNVQGKVTNTEAGVKRGTAWCTWVNGLASTSTKISPKVATLHCGSIKSDVQLLIEIEPKGDTLR